MDMACVVCNRVNVDKSCPGRGLDETPADGKGGQSRSIRWRLEQILREPVNDATTSWICITCFDELKQIEGYYHLLNRYKKMYKQSVSKRDPGGNTDVSNINPPPTSTNTSNNNRPFNTESNHVMKLNLQAASNPPQTPPVAAPASPHFIASPPLSCSPSLTPPVQQQNNTPTTAIRSGPPALIHAPTSTVVAPSGGVGVVPIQSVPTSSVHIHNPAQPGIQCTCDSHTSNGVQQQQASSSSSSYTGQVIFQTASFQPNEFKAMNLSHQSPHRETTTHASSTPELPCKSPLVAAAPNVGMDLSAKSADKHKLNISQQAAENHHIVNTNTPPEEQGYTGAAEELSFAEDLRIAKQREQPHLDLHSVSGLDLKDILQKQVASPASGSPGERPGSNGSMAQKELVLDQATNTHSENISKMLHNVSLQAAGNQNNKSKNQYSGINTMPQKYFSSNEGLFVNTSDMAAKKNCENQHIDCSCFDQSTDEDDSQVYPTKEIIPATRKPIPKLIFPISMPIANLKILQEFSQHNKNRMEENDEEMDNFPGLVQNGMSSEHLMHGYSDQSSSDGFQMSPGPGQISTGQITPDNPSPPLLSNGQCMDVNNNNDDPDEPFKRKRGRPRKNPLPANMAKTNPTMNGIKRKPGRPRKIPRDDEDPKAAPATPIKFTCLTCHEQFDSGADLRQHVRIHSQQNQISCTICKRNFSTQGHLKDHMLMHSSNKHFKCEPCGKSFNSLEQLKEHSVVHSWEMPFICEVCGKGFTQSCSLKTHMVIHSNNKPYNCDFCFKGFTRSTDLRTHVRTHTDDRPFMCTSCGKCFKRSDNLKMHMRIHSGEKPYRCSLCSKRFLATTALKVHMRTHTGERPFPCEVCGKGFRQSGALNEHIRTHTGEKAPKKCVCWQCGKAFTDNSQLKNHMMTHTGEKRFLCNICDKGFILASSLKQHMMNHSGERPHVCKICSKGFTRQGSLVAHMRTHTGERPYYCTECGKSFREAGALKRHKRTHTGDRPYVCEVCAETFTQSHHLKEHLKVVHNIDKKGQVITASKRLMPDNPSTGGNNNTTTNTGSNKHKHTIHAPYVFEDSSASMELNFNDLQNDSAYGVGNSLADTHGQQSSFTPNDRHEEAPMISADLFGDAVLNPHVIQPKDLPWQTQPQMNTHIYSQ